MNTETNFSLEIFWSESVQSRIGFRVNRLVKKFDLKPQDREDLRQEFLLALIKVSKTYDPNKGPAGALITGTLNRRYKKFVRKFKLDQQRAFNDAMGYEDVDPEFEETRIDPTQSHQLALTEHRMDIESVLSKLAPKQQRICRLLQHHSIAETAEILEQSRQNIFYVLGTIRKRFIEAGFENYNF